MFLKLCQEKLPWHMGRRYAKVVETCLACLDSGNLDFGDEEDLMDQYVILVALNR